MRCWSSPGQWRWSRWSSPSCPLAPARAAAAPATACSPSASTWTIADCVDIIIMPRILSTTHQNIEFHPEINTFILLGFPCTQPTHTTTTCPCLVEVISSSLYSHNPHIVATHCKLQTFSRYFKNGTMCHVGCRNFFQLFLLISIQQTPALLSSFSSFQPSQTRTLHFTHMARRRKDVGYKLPPLLTSRPTCRGPRRGTRGWARWATARRTSRAPAPRAGRGTCPALGAPSRRTCPSTPPICKYF